MTDEEWEPGFPYATVERLMSALVEVCASFNQASPLRSQVRQMLDLLDLWDALPTDESRERVLAAVQAVSARYRH